MVVAFRSEFSSRVERWTVPTVDICRPFRALSRLSPGCSVPWAAPTVIGMSPLWGFLVSRFLPA